MTPRKAAAKQHAPAESYRTLAFKARVMADSRRDANFVDSAGAQELLGGVTHQTLRNYMARGLPFEQIGPRVRFFIQDLVIWSSYFEHLKRARAELGSLSIDQAREWYLQRQQRTGEDHAGFVLVPRAWDHPLRALQLQRAAEGLEPPTIPTQATGMRA